MSFTSSNSSQTSPASLVINLVLQKIAEFDNQGLVDNLSRLPITLIPSPSSDTLIDSFLTECMKQNNVPAARIIIEIFDSFRIRVDPLPALTQLLLNTCISRDVLLFTINCFPEKRPLDFFVDLINMDGDILALKAAGLLDTIFPNISSEDWNILYHLTDTDLDDEDEYPNQMLRCFFETKLSETGSCISKPSWVRNYPVVDILPAPDNIPTVKEAIDLLLIDLNKRRITNESVDIQHSSEIKERLISQYAISTIFEKIQMLSPVKHIPPFDDVAMFREFGPVNSIYTVTNTPLDPNHPCSHNGGCRMFTCTEFEQLHFDGEEIDVMAIDEYNDHIERSTYEYTPYGQSDKVLEPITITTVGSPIHRIDWFRKSCDFCGKRISHKHHAVRQPLIHGGWRGCYCSDCLKFSVTDPNQAIMVGRVLEQLDVIGIRDRP